ncbi:hypothetical protein SNEBB_008955 [Seison nebaliae]|nr:hypothetical protein SNEBB_008955 [Seison nebaliae]
MKTLKFSLTQENIDFGQINFPSTSSSFNTYSFKKSPSCVDSICRRKLSILTSSDIDDSVDPNRQLKTSRLSIHVGGGNTSKSSFLQNEKSTSKNKNSSIVVEQLQLSKPVREPKSTIGEYNIYEKIGTGNFSQVRLGVHRLINEKVAIKIVERTKLEEKTKKLLSREIGNLENLSHQHIIRLYEVVETTSKMYIIGEYAPGGELHSRIIAEGHLEDGYASFLFAQIISGLNYLHENHIIHRDLKAENIFFYSDNVVKIGDFGFSIHAEKNKHLNTFCGSPPYAAPELYTDDYYNGEAVDIWACGILLYFMVTGTMPFRADSMSRLRQLIINGKYSIPKSISTDCQFIIERLLRQSWKERMSLKLIMGTSWLENETFANDELKYVRYPNRIFSSKGSDRSSVTTEISSICAKSKKSKIDQFLLFANIGINMDKKNDINRFLKRLERSITYVQLRDLELDHMIKDEKNIRSSLTGIKRIIQHRVQKQVSKVIYNALHNSNESLREQFTTVLRTAKKAEENSDKTLLKRIKLILLEHHPINLTDSNGNINRNNLFNETVIPGGTTPQAEKRLSTSTFNSKMLTLAPVIPPTPAARLERVRLKSRNSRRVVPDTANRTNWNNGVGGTKSKSKTCTIL